ncbi:TIGR02921 family PEP-CTERM protein [Limnofasciculus baicalensis]|uniref:TIGR02921 family PEP-CTERM protein n=1 Tax=Limnofasciculus baicalensis BBK-W-15 TaxID=2699891 RepID=A0AAE3GT43_9CYAN|nr:TIGR02921 family PEP-CTERM protein [Limnofasciculus baicalensis]MCP2730181.1 TIGR02921 family PEP-CTERM protein [Limnofasciculus baicalensis BBK-W-15]
MKTLLTILGAAIFWLWNIAFLVFVYIWMLPAIGVGLFNAIVAGEIENEFLIPLLGLIVIPTVCTLIGGWRLRKRPLELMRLFYGVEAPLFTLCLVRLFVVRELTPASTLILGTGMACVLAFLFDVLHGYAKDNRVVAWLQLIFHSLMVLVGVFVGVLLLFYTVPAAAVFIPGFFRHWLILTNFTLENPLWIIQDILLIILFSFSSTLFVGMPAALAFLYIESPRYILHRFAEQYGQKRTIQGVLAVVTAWMVLFISFQQQPQIKVFNLLDNSGQTDKERQELLAKSDIIRSGLLNAYLSSYRYISPIEENDHIFAMYRDVFELPDSICQFLQNSYNTLMSPFLYNGSRADSERAEKLYADFFDAPLQKAERKAVQHALQSTAILDEAKAGVLNINQKKVWLRSQNITIQEHGDWAEVELYEVYENKTNAVEEILYYFSLPESATITGIWLGDSDNRDKRFPFKVSPRGAAQKVYNSQVRRERPMDPALLEQVGSHLYRLRAFPVPPKLASWEKNNSTNRPTKMHLWLTYKVMRQPEGWAMPSLGEKRNIFWTENTQRNYGGQVVKTVSDNWIPSFLPPTTASPLTLHQVNLENGYHITAKPLTKEDYALPENQQFAIVLDTSRSMGAQNKELTETFNWLKKHGFSDNNCANNDADLYVTAASGIQPKRIDDIRTFEPAKMTFYGTIQYKEMLRQFVKLQGDTAYDGILVLTDEGSYELTDNSKDIPAISAPLWMVHLGALPPAYDDATLKAIQDSGGGISTKLPEVLQRLATQAKLGSSVVSVVDGYAWFVEKIEVNQPLNQSNNTSQNSESAGLIPAATNIVDLQIDQTNTYESESFAPIAARQLVIGLSKEIDGNQVAELDAIHAIAKTYKIVTPYSSMIVLVNDEQREALRIAEAEKDRFNRKVEKGKEGLNQPNNPMKHSDSVSVPEPSMVVGLGAIVFILIFSRRKMFVKKS